MDGLKQRGTGRMTGIKYGTCAARMQKQTENEKSTKKTRAVLSHSFRSCGKLFQDCLQQKYPRKNFVAATTKEEMAGILLLAHLAGSVWMQMHSHYKLFPS